MRSVGAALILAVSLAACGDSSGSRSAPTATATPPPPTLTSTPGGTPATPSPTFPPPPTKVANCTGYPDGTHCVHPCGNGVCQHGACTGECTPSATVTSSRSETPACVPTPLVPPCCAEHCDPCPTFRPGCYAVACVQCVESPTCDHFPRCDGGPSPTPTPQPTCVPTLGVPSCCAAHCEPCPTIRAGCNARACQDCIERPVCDPIPTCDLLVSTATPTPTRTCDTPATPLPDRTCRPDSCGHGGRCVLFGHELTAR